MPDLFRLVTLMDSGRPRLVADLNAELSGYVRVRDSFAYTAPEQRARTAQGSGPYQGDRVYPSGHGNASVASTFTVKGGDAPAAARRLEELLALAARTLAGREGLIEWRAEGLARSVYFPVRGPATAQPTYRVRAFAGSSSPLTEVAVTWPVAPLADGLPMTVDETFEAAADKPSGLVNLVPNPSAQTAEAGVTGWAGVSATLARAALGIGGVIRITATAGSYAARSDQVPVTPGALYAAMLDLIAVTTGTLRVDVEWYGASGTLLSTSNGTAVAAGATSKVVAAAPAAARTAAVVARHTAGAAGNVADVDRVALMLVPAGTTTATAPAYFDGDSPTGRWTDLAHGSCSVELAEAKLAEWTVDEDGGQMFVRNEGTGVEPRGGLVPGVDVAANWRTRMRHTGRGYGLYDPAVMMTFAPGSGPTGITRFGAGKAITASAFVYARLSIDHVAATASYELVREVDGVETVLVGPTAIAVPVGDRPHGVMLHTAGRYARALWFAPGAAPDLIASSSGATAWADMGSDAFAGPGDAFITATRVGLPGRITRVRVLPYAFPEQVNGPRINIARGIPGNAPARADVEVHSLADAGIAFGLLSWWRKPQPHNIMPLGDLDPVTGTDFWFTTTLSATAALAAGGTVTRMPSSTAGSPLFHAFARINAATTVNRGAAVRLHHRFLRGRTYTIEYNYRANAGAWQDLLYADGTLLADGGFASQAVPATVGAAWARRRRTYTPPNDRDAVELLWRKTAAGAAGDNLDIANLRVYEGTVGPVDVDQAEGRGGLPPVGLFLAGADRPSGRSASFAMLNGITAATRSLVMVPAAGAGGSGVNGNQGFAEWIIDPSAYLEADDTDDTLALEVWGHGDVADTNLSTRVTVSLRPWPLVAGATLYTSEYGANGKLLQLGSGDGIQAWRLGTLIVPREAGGFGRAVLRVDAAIGSTTGGQFAIYYLFVVPARRRASSPSGKAYDGTYPRFLANGTPSTPSIKRIRHDLRGRLEHTNGYVGSWDQGLGGAPIHPNPGDNMVAAWMLAAGFDAPPVTGVPDDPTPGLTAGPNTSAYTFGYSLNVTPRYRLWRPE